MAQKLEGAYIPRRALRRFDPHDDTPRPTLNEGQFYLAPNGPDWIIQRHIMREHEVVLAGPAPHTLIDPVATEDLQGAVLWLLREWWRPMLEPPHGPVSSGGAGYQAYAVLTMCRALYALRFGRIVSKPVAARWAQATLAARWADLSTRALAWRNGEEFVPLAETLAFVRYTIEQGQQFDPE